jgi:biopolymer transport protein ExbD
MGISMGKGGQSAISDPNMTPMIDVLLVLLVIFILVQMNLQRTFDIQLPVDKDSEQSVQSDNIIMEIRADGGVSINTQNVQPAQLRDFLFQIYKDRPNKIIFVKAEPQAQYGKVIEYIDTARDAGVIIIGAVLTPTLATAPGTP